MGDEISISPEYETRQGAIDAFNAAFERLDKPFSATLYEGDARVAKITKPKKITLIGEML